MERWKDKQNSKIVLFSLASEKFRHAEDRFLGIFIWFLGWDFF